MEFGKLPMTTTAVGLHCSMTRREMTTISNVYCEQSARPKATCGWPCAENLARTTPVPFP
jgi:hypothetical protein